MIDIERLRRDTPSCATRVHMNNAGASPAPEPVKQAVLDHIEREAKLGGYVAEDDAAAEVEDFYAGFATLLNCRPDEIAFVESATRAWDMAFYSIPFMPGDRVITSASEYASNFLALLHLKRTKGIEIDIAESDETGQISVAAVERAITPRTKLIAITHVPTQGGLVNPAAAIGRIAKAHGVLYLLDACQSLGQMPIDVAAIGCDFLAGTGRKFLRGPRGTGMLFVRRAVLETSHPPFVDLRAATWVSDDDYVLRDDARRFEAWESFVAGKIGLARAVRYALAIGLDKIEQRVRLLASRMRDNLGSDHRVALGDLGAEKCAIVTLRRNDEDPAATQSRLTSAHVTSSLSLAEYARLDFGQRNLDSLLRLSVHYFNTEDEVDVVCRLVLASA